MPTEGLIEAATIHGSTPTGDVDMRRSPGQPFVALATLLSAALVLVIVAGGGFDPARAPTAAPNPWTCPMHPDILETQQGACPLCRMQLVQVRLDTVWSCPVHSVVMEDGPGPCPLCRRDLLKMPVTVSWTCGNRPDIQVLEPGRCPDGAPMTLTRTLRPHGNHSPQHGGQFFMAADNWHHVEGTRPQPRLFRLHVYDDYSKPLGAADMRGITGRIVTAEQFDPVTRTTRELAVQPLRLSPDGTTLEGPLDGREITAKIRFKDDGPEFRFDFTFGALSEPAPAVAEEATVTAPPTVAALPAQAPTESPTLATPVVPTPADDTVTALLAQLRQLDAAIAEHIAIGAFDDVYRPAFAAKDLALTLGEHGAGLPPGARQRVADAIATLVRMAWRLDAFGDLGNRPLLLEADAQFGVALDDIERSFSSYGATTSSATGSGATTSSATGSGASMRVPAASVTGVASQ